jgi:hypothetical protein
VKKIRSDNAEKACPFMKTPFDACYCAKNGSPVIEQVLNFCGGNYRQCEIYKSNRHRAREIRAGVIGERR